MIGFDLTQEQKDLRDACTSSRATSFGRRRRSTTRRKRRPGRSCSRPTSSAWTPTLPRGVRRRRRDRHGDADDRHRGAVVGLRGHRHRHQRHRPVRDGDPAVRHARAEGQVHADVLRPEAGRAGGDGADRGRGRLRRLGDAHQRQARRRRLPAQRLEALHHQRRHRRRARHLRHDRSRGRLGRHPGVRRRQRQSRSEGRQEGTQDGRARLAHRRGHPRRLLRADREPAGRRARSRAASAC